MYSLAYYDGFKTLIHPIESPYLRTQNQEPFL